MSEVFDKVIASLGKIPSPFEVGRKLGLNIPTGEDITGEDIKDILSIIGPQADVKAMVEESSRIVPALKKGDILEALSSFVLSAVAPLMIGSPGTVSGIRKGSEGLASLGESRKIKAKPKHKSSDLVTHAASDSDLPSIAKEGLRYGTHVEPAGDKIWAEGLHRLIYNKLPEDVGKLVSRKGMEDMPFYKLQQSIDADEIKMIEFPADDYPDILKETKRLKKLFGKTKVRPYWQNENGKIFYSESAADKSQAVLDRKSAKRAAEKIAYEESQMQPGFYVDRMTDQRPTLKYDPGQPDWYDLKRSTGGLVGLI